MVAQPLPAYDCLHGMHPLGPEDLQHLSQAFARPAAMRSSASYMVSDPTLGAPPAYQLPPPAQPGVSLRYIGTPPVVARPQAREPVDAVSSPPRYEAPPPFEQAHRLSTAEPSIPSRARVSTAAAAPGFNYS
jgi:hypothetical protein